MDNQPEPNEVVQRGLKLLSARHRKLHPVAQVQTLRRIAVRALNDAEWRTKYARWASSPSEEYELARQKNQRASDAMEAAVWLNEVHNLGYPTRRTS